MKSADAEDFTLAVIGAGAMGQGIALVSLQGGMNVILVDSRPGGAADAAKQIAARLDRSVEKGRLEAGDAAAMRARLTTREDLGMIESADTVVEAVFEDLAVKQELFQRIEGIVGVDVPIATNTSSIPIASIGRVCNHRARVAGMHFFNPMPLMKLVEIIRGPDTDDTTTAHLTALGKRMTRIPVTVKDSPGFLVNLGGRAYTTEGLRIQQEAVATPAQIDAVMRDCAGFPMGPFELMDLTGIDVNHPVSEFVHREFQSDPRLKTTPHHKLLKEAGRFGRKSGAGHFTYDAGGNKIDPPSPDFTTDAITATFIWVPEPTDTLMALLDGTGMTSLIEDDGAVPIVAAPLGEDATAFAFRNGVDPARLVAIDTTGSTDKRITIMTPPGAGPDALGSVAAALIATGRTVTAIKDSPGFILQRMRAMIANLGCEMAQMDLASPSDIDLALKSGLNYPLGPLEITEDIGARETLDIMEQLQVITGDDRYRPSLWLRRRALLSLPVHTEN